MFSFENISEHLKRPHSKKEQYLVGRAVQWVFPWAVRSTEHVAAWKIQLGVCRTSTLRSEDVAWQNLDFHLCMQCMHSLFWIVVLRLSCGSFLLAKNLSGLKLRLQTEAYDLGDLTTRVVVICWRACISCRQQWHKEPWLSELAFQHRALQKLQIWI